MISCIGLKSIFQESQCCAHPTASVPFTTLESSTDAELAQTYPHIQTFLRDIRNVSCEDMKNVYTSTACCTNKTASFTEAQNDALTWRTELTEAEADARNQLMYLIYASHSKGRYDFWRAKLIVQSGFAGYWSNPACAGEEATSVSWGRSAAFDARCSYRGVAGGEAFFDGPPSYNDYPSYSSLDSSTKVPGPYYTANLRYYTGVPADPTVGKDLQQKGLYDLHQDMATARASIGPSDPVHTVHKILKAKLYLRAADEYGAMPLVEDFHPEVEQFEGTVMTGNFRYKRCESSTTCPAMQSGEHLYVAAVDLLLDAADDDVSSGTPLGAFDPMFAGDASKWKKLANTLLLRTAMRMYTNVDARCAKGDCGPYTKAQLEDMVRGAVSRGVLTDDDAKVHGYQLPDGKLPPYSLFPPQDQAYTYWLMYSTINRGDFGYTPLSDVLIDLLGGDPRLPRMATPAEPRNLTLSTDDYALLSPILPESVLAHRVDTYKYSVTLDPIPPVLTASDVRTTFDTATTVTKYRTVRTYTIEVKIPYGMPQGDDMMAGFMRSIGCKPSWGRYGYTIPADCAMQIQHDATRALVPFASNELGQCATAYYTVTDDASALAHRFGDQLRNISFPTQVPHLPLQPPNRNDGLTEWIWNYEFAQGQQYEGSDPIVVNDEDLIVRDWLEATKMVLNIWHPREEWRSKRGTNALEWISWAGNEDLALSCMEMPKIVDYKDYVVESFSPNDATISVAGQEVDKAFQINLGQIPEGTHLGMPLRHRVPLSNNVFMSFSRFGPEVADTYGELGDYNQWTETPEPEQTGVGNWHQTISAAETNLLLAEATVHGILHDEGTVEELVQKGMQKSYDQFRVNAVAPTPNFVSECALCPVRKIDKLRFIWEQKWLAVYPNVLEGWTIVRETGAPSRVYRIPNTEMYHPGITNGRVPQRMFYGLDYDGDNAGTGSGTGEVKILHPPAGFVDDVNTPLWWSLGAVDPPSPPHVATDLIVREAPGCPDSTTWKGFNANFQGSCSDWANLVANAGSCDAAANMGATAEAILGAKLNCPTACGLTEDSTTWKGFNANFQGSCSDWANLVANAGSCDAAANMGATADAILGAKLNCPIACCPR